MDMDDGRNDDDGCVLLLLNCGDSIGLLLNCDCIGDCMLVMLLLLLAVVMLLYGCGCCCCCCCIEGCRGWMINWPDDGGLNGCCCDICC